MASELNRVETHKRAGGTALTWRGGLDLRSLVLFVVCKNLRRRVFTALNFALEGIKTLDVLFLQRAGSTAGCAHI